MPYPPPHETSPAAEYLDNLVKNVELMAFENEQEEEIESMQAADLVEASSNLKGNIDNKRAKLDKCEASLKTASAQVVVSNTLLEYARYVTLY